MQVSIRGGLPSRSRDLLSALGITLTLEKIRLTPAESNALKSALRFGETPLEFITAAINSELARRESLPRRGTKAVQVLRQTQSDEPGLLQDIEITVRLQPTE